MWDYISSWGTEMGAKTASSLEVNTMHTGRETKDGLPVHFPFAIPVSDTVFNWEHEHTFQFKVLLMRKMWLKDTHDCTSKLYFSDRELCELISE